MYANIIIDITHEKLDKIFQYRIPRELENELSIGTEVIVPFGKGNRETSGYVIGFSKNTDYDPEKIKPVLKIAEKRMAIESKLVSLAAWMKEYYGGTMIQALKTVLPIKKQENIRQKRTVRLLMNEEDAKMLLANGCICVTEGANMPCTPEAIFAFQNAKILYSPGKASNAGGVATSGLEMSQNSMRLRWAPEEVDGHLRRIMTEIHQTCVKYGTEEDGYVNYVKGANIAGFIKVAEAMMAQGLV